QFTSQLELSWLKSTPSRLRYINDLYQIESVIHELCSNVNYTYYTLRD
ncbi:6801_t:CDS:1, partial [Racocetra persica]